MEQWVSEVVTIANSLVTPLALVAAILAWLAKLRWAKENIATKDETIRAKDALVESLRTQLQERQTTQQEIIKAKDEQLAALRLHMDFLREQTSPVLLARLLKTKKGAEALVELGEKEVEAAHARIDELTSQLAASQEGASIERAKLVEERAGLVARADALEKQLADRTLAFETWRLLSDLTSKLERPALGLRAGWPYAAGGWMFGTVPPPDDLPSQAPTDVSAGSALGEQQRPGETHAEPTPPGRKPNREP